MSKRLCYRFLRLLLERPQQTQRFEVSQSDIMLTMGISLQTCHKLAHYCLLPQGFQYLAPSRWQKRLFIGGIILVLFFMYLSQ
jgi:hypothetical protein